MNLVKWFRKNNTKVMAVVVIILMVGFIGGSSLSYLLQGTGGAKETIAHYGSERVRITRADRFEASRELEILQALRIDTLMGYQDLRGLLLSQLLFSQSSGSGPMMDAIRQAVQQNRYRVDDRQLLEMTERTVPTDIYWLLLRNEAQAAGFGRPLEDVGEILGQVLGQLFQGETYATVMRAQGNRFNVPEATIVATFGKLLAVLEYADAICSLQNTTTAQLRYTAAVEGESMDIEFVEINAASFADKDATPPTTELQAQFDAYKDFFPGEVSEANPFGFGYKLRPRIQLEYIVLKLEDIASMVRRPTSQEMEAFYQQNRDQLYTEQVASDPNDPNSPTVPQVRSYAEVAEQIRTRLLHERVTTQAQQILLEAKNTANAGLDIVGSAQEERSLEVLAQEAGDYAKIAEDLGHKHGLGLYSGQTGLLSAVAMQEDERLGQLALTDYGSTPIQLIQMLFSVEQLGDDAAVLLSGPRAEMYRSIGPAQESATVTDGSISGRIMALVRIVDAKPAGPPESLTATFSTRTLGLGDDPQDEANDLYSVQEQVVEDVRKLTVWDTTKDRAAEFVSLVAETDWDQAVDQFNALYGEQAKDDPNDPDVFSVDRLFGVQPISSDQLLAIKAQTAHRPSAAMFVERLTQEQQLVNRFYALVPPDSSSLPETPVALEYPPDMSVYCLKSLSIERLPLEQFQQMKGMVLRRGQYTDGQSLAAVHFNPNNILDRMQFEFVEQLVEPAAEDAS